MIGTLVNRYNIGHHDAEDAFQEGLIAAWRNDADGLGFVVHSAKWAALDVHASRRRDLRLVNAYVAAHAPFQRMNGGIIEQHDCETHYLPMYTDKYRDDVLHGESYMEKLRRQDRERRARRKLEEAA